MIFLRVSPNGGSKIRGCLNLPDNVEPSDTETPFFDPDSQSSKI